MFRYQALIYAMIDLCDEFGMEWAWLDDGTGIQVDLGAVDEFSRYRFIRETKRLRKDFLGEF